MDLTRGLATPAPQAARGRSTAQTYNHPFLTEVWPEGFHSVGQLTEASAAYTAAYTLKKLEKDEPGRYDRSFDGLEWTVAPEFHLHSRRPGLGIEYLERFYRDIYGTRKHPRSGVSWRNSTVSPPLAYDRWLKEHDLAHYHRVKAWRLENTADNSEFLRYIQKSRETILASKEALFGTSTHGDPGA